MPGEQEGAAASSALPLCCRRLASCFSSGLTRASACNVDTSAVSDLLKNNNSECADSHSHELLLNQPVHKMKSVLATEERPE